MIRRPLRPLARVLWARDKGLDPDAEEAARRARALNRQRVEERRRAEWRLMLLGVTFVFAFGAVAGQMALLAATEPAEPRIARAAVPLTTTRADIVDRNGLVLATNLVTSSLYAEIPHLVDARAAADGLAGIFPELDAERVYRQMTDGRSFMWLRRAISPEQRQAVHDLGEPGLRFGTRQMRLYPNGARAAHILGGVSFGAQDVHTTEIVGRAGIERALDARLRDPARAGEALRLSIDLRVQNALRDVLADAMERFTAAGATGVLMRADTGEVVALVSLPDFDPNDRPGPVDEGARSPRFNQAAQGTYELGSTYKLFTAAMALERQVAGPETMIDTRGPMRWGRFLIRDFRDYGPELSLTDVIVKSSNIGTAHLALTMGAEAQQAFLGELGLLAPTGIELSEAAGGVPLTPANWSEISTITISYGHGITATPLHLAASYASILNGGLRVTPTLLAGATPPGEEARVVSPETSRQLRSMLRQVVTRGTASFADVPGYEVGGKTGTADKPRAAGGGYYDDRVIATFAGIFPASDPDYVLVVTLDEPTDRSGREPRRTAGWTAVPAAAEAIRRVAPLLGMRPNPVRAATRQISGVEIRGE
ncbi:MAG: penicillin-binding protein 2 [Pseudomonadota bacterium]